jgi:trans-2,3-dihydro-3-hydroxyanthranilate isomerase
MERPIAFLDVFAERPLAGNCLAVVGDGDGLSEEVMLAFARETRLSETTFVQSAGAGGADYRNRIWDMREELPFAGHPSLGTAVAVARWRGLDEVALVQQTGAGLQPLEVRAEGECWSATMLQNEPEFGPELDRDPVMAAVGLEAADAHPELPPQIVSTGLPHLITPVARAEVLARALPDWSTIDQLLRPHGAIVLYLAWWEADAGRARARSFSGTVEMGEDPATGSAAAPLCAYLAQRRGSERLVISQGVEMGRPSVLETAIEDGRVRVGGSVIPLIEGTVMLPSR